MEKERYRHLNKYLKNKFGERTLKICIDAGFTCPNRDGTCGVGGCIFCKEKENELFKIEDIKNNIIKHLNSYKGERANKFIVYFQNYTNTYDTLENLKKKYDSALIDTRIVGLSIATRPDCITEDIVKLIAEYKKKLDVVVELGFQTSNDKTALIINRGYTKDVFENAVSLLHKYGIEVIVHIMVGLPNETKQDVLNTVNCINNLNVEGIKIHSTFVIKDTILENLYNEGKYIPLTYEDYMENLVDIITHLNPNIIIHRISGDSDKDTLIAPLWTTRKKWVLNGIDKILKEKDFYQGCMKKK